MPSESEIVDHYSNMQEQQSTHYEQHNKRRLARIQQTHAGNIIANASTLLELGPGKNGVLPIAAAVKAYYAIELSTFNKQELAKKSNGITLHIYEQLAQVSNPVNVAVLISFLEHAINPRETISLLAEKIEEGGHCVIAVPLRSLEQLHGNMIFQPENNKLSFSWPDGDHLHSFSDDSMQHMVNEAGMHIVHREQIGFDAVLSCIYQQYTAINQLLETSSLYSLRKITHILLRALLIRVYAMCGKSEKGDYLVIYTCKK